MKQRALIPIVGLALVIVVGGGVALSLLTDSGSNADSPPKILLPAVTLAPTPEPGVTSEPNTAVAPDPNFEEGLQ